MAILTDYIKRPVMSVIGGYQIGGYVGYAEYYTGSECGSFYRRDYFGNNMLIRLRKTSSSTIELLVIIGSSVQFDYIGATSITGCVNTTVNSTSAYFGGQAVVAEVIP